MTPLPSGSFTILLTGVILLSAGLGVSILSITVGSAYRCWLSFTNGESLCWLVRSIPLALGISTIGVGVALTGRGVSRLIPITRIRLKQSWHVPIDISILALAAVLYALIVSTVQTGINLMIFLIGGIGLFVLIGASVLPRLLRSEESP